MADPDEIKLVALYLPCPPERRHAYLLAFELMGRRWLEEAAPVEEILFHSKLPEDDSDVPPAGWSYIEQEV